MTIDAAPHIPDNKRSDLLVILNPWQTMMSALLFSLIPDMPNLAIFEWDPRPGKDFVLLRKFNNELHEASSPLEDLLPISIDDLSKKIETRIAAYQNATYEPINFMVHLRPKKILILAETIPPDTFWRELPKDAEVNIVAYPQTFEQIKDLGENSPPFKNHPRKNAYQIQRPTDLILVILQILKNEPLPESIEAITTGDSPEEIFTGLYYAIKEGIPLWSARIAGDKPYFVTKTTISTKNNK